MTWNASSRNNCSFILTKKCLIGKEGFDTVLSPVMSTPTKSHLMFKAVCAQKLQLEDFLFSIVSGNITGIRNRDLTTQRPLSFSQEFTPEKQKTRNLVPTCNSCITHGWTSSCLPWSGQFVSQNIDFSWSALVISKVNLEQENGLEY